jgi:macrodomain Ter protein organizer (MatP/YcbG family)
MDAQRYRRITSQRMTITLSGLVFQRIEERSQREGRSMSNLVAYLLERSLCDEKQTGT